MARTEHRLSRLHTPSEEDVPDEVKELWAKPLERFGFVPNVMRAFSLRPEHLVRWWNY